MNITYNDITIDLFPRGVPKKVMLSLSGGLDSASLLFVICKHLPEIEVIPFTGKDKYAPFDFLSAQMILQWMKDRFPNHNIQEHEWFEFDVKDPVLLEHARSKWEDEKVLVNGELVPRCARLSGLVKIFEIRKFTNKVFLKHGQPLIVTGMTGNPPEKDMKEHGFYELREARRDSGHTVKEYSSQTRYQPFINLDKKFVADIYFKNDIMDLYDLTSSCVGSVHNTNYFTEPCMECFWCHEKEWAFKR